MRVHRTINVTTCQQFKKQKFQQGLLLSAAAIQINATRSDVLDQLQAYVCDPIYIQHLHIKAWRVQLHAVVQQQNTKPLQFCYAHQHAMS